MLHELPEQHGKYHRFLHHTDHTRQIGQTGGLEPLVSFESTDAQVGDVITLYARSKQFRIERVRLRQFPIQREVLFESEVPLIHAVSTLLSELKKKYSKSP